MAMQKIILKRKMFDAAGVAIGAEAALAAGIPGEVADTAPVIAHPFVTTAAVKYGGYADGGIVIGPKEGVRFADIADGIDVAVGTPVTVATKAHVFVGLADQTAAADSADTTEAAVKAATDAATAAVLAKLAKGAPLYAANGVIQTAVSGDAVAKIYKADVDAGFVDVAVADKEGDATKKTVTCTIKAPVVVVAL